MCVVVHCTHDLRLAGQQLQLPAAGLLGGVHGCSTWSTRVDISSETSSYTRSNTSSLSMFPGTLFSSQCHVTSDHKSFLSPEYHRTQRGAAHRAATFADFRLKSASTATHKDGRTASSWWLTYVAHEIISLRLGVVASPSWLYTTIKRTSSDVELAMAERRSSSGRSTCKIIPTPTRRIRRVACAEGSQRV